MNSMKVKNEITKRIGLMIYLNILIYYYLLYKQKGSLFYYSVG